MIKLLDTLDEQAPAWSFALKGVLSTERTAALEQFLNTEFTSGKVIYPDSNAFFAALGYTPLGSVRAVILGQDPYHGPHQAHGLSFSVQPGVQIPPSLKNIYKELHEDIQCDVPDHGYLKSWAEQGVLMLNSVLSVELSSPASHAKKGWEEITDAIIASVNEQEEPTAFVLWGKYAQEKAPSLDGRHLVIRTAHPSPFAARKGFFGSRPFSQVNRFLLKHGRGEIDWSIG